ncbi:hypothetical protein HK104_001568 [Borealophlyctis nickersoniae]|nr:hypothetical protein HK104_001568 [Borealophlyctis nickersoniae]
MVWEVDVNGGDEEKSVLDQFHATHAQTHLWGLAPHPSHPHKLLTASGDGWIQLWDVNSHTLLESRYIHAKFLCCCWSPDSFNVALGTDDGTVLIFMYDLKTRIAVLQDQRQPIYDLKYSPNGRYLAVGGHDGAIDIYKVDENGEGGYSRVMCGKGHGSFVTHMDWSIDSMRLMSNSGNGEVMFWTVPNDDAPTPPEIDFKDAKWATTTCTLGWATRGVYGKGAKAEMGDLGLREVNCCARLTPTKEGETDPASDGLLALGTTNGKVYLLRYPAYEPNMESRCYPVHGGQVSNVAFSSDGRYLFSMGATDGCLFQWRISV